MNVGLANNYNTYNSQVKLNNSRKPGQQQQMVSFTGKDKAQPKVALSVLPSLIHGFVQPIKDIVTAVIKAPIPSALILGVTAAGMRCSKLFGTVLTMGICTYGAAKMGISSIKALKAINTEKTKDLTDRDYSKANAQISEFGEGVFDVALTANSAAKGAVSLVNTAKAVTTAKTATMAQKVLAVIKQAETPEAILSLPKTSKGAMNAFKNESLNEFSKLTKIITGNSKAKTTKMSEEVTNLLKNSEGNKEKLIQGLRTISENLKEGSASKNKINQLLQNVGGEGITKLSAAHLKQIDQILAGIESTSELPGGVRVLRQVMKSTNSADDVGRVIVKYLKGAKAGGENTAKAGIASSLGDDR